MSSNELFFELDNLALSLQRGTNALGAVHDAMEAGDYTADTYVEGLFFIWEQMNGMCLQLRSLVDAGFEMKRGAQT